jgi:hypothetical protein
MGPRRRGAELEGWKLRADLNGLGIRTDRAPECPQGVGRSGRRLDLRKHGLCAALGARRRISLHQIKEAWIGLRHATPPSHCDVENKISTIASQEKMRLGFTTPFLRFVVANA